MPRAEPAPGAPPRKMVTLLMYGDAKAIEIAERMIFEAVDNNRQQVSAVFLANPIHGREPLGLPVSH
eukprot:1160672-Pelagomonas_calceolata.AAC.2